MMNLELDGSSQPRTDRDESARERNHPLTRAFHTRARPLINTVASARCRPGPLQPFQRFGWERPKPLKRLGHPAAHAHRAEAAVSMRLPAGAQSARAERGFKQF